MDLIKLLDRPHHKSITNLLIFFLHEKKISKGLKQIHFRYALMENHGLSNKTVEEMKASFGSNLQICYDKKFLIKNCINSNTKLSNYLKTLEDYELIEKKGSRPNAYYYPTLKLLTIHQKERVRSLMESIIDDINLLNFPYRLDHHTVEHIIEPEKLINLCEKNNIPQIYMLTKSWILNGFSYWDIRKIIKNNEFVHAILEIEKNLFIISKIHNDFYKDKSSSIGFVYKGGIHNLFEHKQIRDQNMKEINYKINKTITQIFNDLSPQIKKNNMINLKD